MIGFYVLGLYFILVLVIVWQTTLASSLVDSFSYVLHFVFDLIWLVGCDFLWHGHQAVHALLAR